MTDWSNGDFWDDNNGVEGKADGEEVVGTVGDGAAAKKKANSLNCANCGSTAIESLGAQGHSVCTVCGTIVEENTLVSTVDFVEGAGGSSSMVGTFVGASGTGGQRAGQYGFSQASRENTLRRAKREIQGVAGLMRLDSRYVDAAHRLFNVALERNFTQGRRRAHVVAACMYVSCRQEKSHHMLIDFSDALQINVYLLGTTFLKLRRMLGIKLEVIDPALYIYRFAAHLNLDEKANQVSLTALRVVARMKRDWIVAGRRPAGICAAALLIASRAHGFEREHDVTDVLKICGLTVMKRVKEFERTKAANLTLEELHEKEIEEEAVEEEADPPAFTANRIQEARAKAVAERDIDLLESGALDDPNHKGWRASKWRRGKSMSEKDKEFAEMYSELETEMAEDKDENALDSNATAENSGDGELPTISFTRAEKQIEHKKPLGISTLHGEIPYPVGQNKLPLILPNEATAEELQAPTQKTEDVLDFGEWKALVPASAANDVDLLFRSDDEVREREAVFNAQNKEYLESQQIKEQERLAAEAAARAKHKDELAQEEGRKRYLKTARSRKKDGWDPNDLTTEEALLEVVRARKISRKINYDAMSSLFDDSGDFSTDLLRKKEEGVEGEA